MNSGTIGTMNLLAIDWQHPLVQSLWLPLGLALVATGLLRLALGRRGAHWAMAGLGLSVVVASAWLAGLHWPPTSLTHKLPLILLLAWLAAGVMQAAGTDRIGAGVVALLLWAAALWWLGVRDPAHVVGALLAGALVLAALLLAPVDRAHGPAMLVVASLGLAGVAMVAGSLLLFQWSVLLAAATGGAALWLWPVALARFSLIASMTGALAWLALAQATVQLTRAPWWAVLVLVAVFAAARVARRLPGRGALLQPVVVAVVAGLVAGAAVLGTQWALGGGSDGAGGDDDAYYTPRW